MAVAPFLYLCMVKISTVPPRANKVEEVLKWLKEKDGARTANHFMHAVNIVLKRHVPEDSLQ